VGKDLANIAVNSDRLGMRDSLGECHGLLSRFGRRSGRSSVLHAQSEAPAVASLDRRSTVWVGEERRRASSEKSRAHGERTEDEQKVVGQHGRLYLQGRSRSLL
jgi:hypothetical protein